MTSRRRFLQANLLGLACTLPQSEIFGFTVPSNGKTNLPSDANERDYWNDWPRYFIDKMNSARELRLSQLKSIKTEADVRTRNEYIRSTLWKLLGGQFDKTPLKPRTVGTIDRGDYRIEKVIFESRPEVFVTANLYIPNHRKPPFPAVAVPLGHSVNGKSSYYYQYVCQSLARLGYIAFPFDPFGQGERKQYLNPKTGKGLYGPTQEHNQAGYPMLLFGSQFAQYRVWDGIRAVDYLLSRPEVDPNRIGCTGNSGGGTMTMYLAALDPRIKVAVASDANSANMAGPAYIPPGDTADAEQNIVGGLAEGIDRGDLLLAFAPKPLLILYSRTDSGRTYGPRYVDGTKEVYSEALATYKMLGVPDKVRLFGSPLPHAYDFFNRREACRWFNRWLGSADWNTKEAAFDDSPPGTLHCTSTGEVLTSLGGMSVTKLNTNAMLMVAPPQKPLNTSDDAQELRRGTRATLKDLLSLDTRRTALHPHTLTSDLWMDDISVEAFTFYSEPWVRVTGWFLKPSNGHAPYPTVVYVTDRDKNEILEETNKINGLVRRGFAVCAIDLRGLGMSVPHYPPAGPVFYRGGHLHEGYAWAGLVLGKSVLGQRVWDLLRCLDYLQSRSDVDHNRIHGLGEQSAALAVLLSGVLDDRLHSVLLDRPIATWRSIVGSESYSLDLSWFLFGVLKHFDLPDLVGMLAPRRCCILNPTNAQAEPLADSELPAIYRRSVEIFEKSNARGRLKLAVCPEQKRLNVIQSWLSAG